MPELVPVSKDSSVNSSMAVQQLDREVILSKHKEQEKATSTRRGSIVDDNNSS